MRKNLVIVFAMVMALFCGMTINALAADKIISAQISQATTAIDKNGNEYVRFIVPEERSLQGVKYTQGVPVMIFGESVAKAKTFKVGDSFRAIVSTKEYKGNLSYRLIAFIDS